MADNGTERLRTDSPISRRIVLAFLDFLSAVEPAAGVDLEGLDVVRECLEEAFKLNQSSADENIQHGFLVDVFRSYDKQQKSRPALDSEATSTISMQNTANGKLPEASKVRRSSDLLARRRTATPLSCSSLSKDVSRDSQFVEVSRDELFGQFYAALDKINFFNATPGGDEDHAQLAKATQFFEDALLDLEKSGDQKLSRHYLAETLKSQGNQAMQSKLYTEAIELYTCAVALLENNAIYYCNRAAAYTQIHKYTEAIVDCTKSIELDPSYAKAYSRLGLVYYAQGKYQEALSGFHKALQLDPNNDSVRENIRVAEQRWREESRRVRGEQNTGSSHNQQTNTQNPGPRSNHVPFTSIPINASLPADFANIFMSMASAAGSNHSQEQSSQSAESRSQGTPPFTSAPMSTGLPSDFTHVFMNMTSGPPGQETRDQTPNDNVDGSNQPEMRIDANVNVNLDEVPDISGALRSVMDMFAQQRSQERTSRD